MIRRRKRPRLPASTPVLGGAGRLRGCSAVWWLCLRRSYRRMRMRSRGGGGRGGVEGGGFTRPYGAFIKVLLAL